MGRDPPAKEMREQVAVTRAEVENALAFEPEFASARATIAPPECALKYSGPKASIEP